MKCEVCGVGENGECVVGEHSCELVDPGKDSFFSLHVCFEGLVEICSFPRATFQDLSEISRFYGALIKISRKFRVI